MKRVLSLDGGGIRGVLSARLVDRLDRVFPDWTGEADLIAGTSTGGILALALASRMSPARIVTLYEERAKSIFGNRDWSDHLSPDELWRANYSQEGLKDALVEVFGDKKLSELHIRVLIPCFELATWKPYFIDSQREGNLSLVDAALRTSAAPTLFPSHQGFVDGGVAANNPSDCAVACLQNDGVKNKDMMVVSVGTGKNPRSMTGGDHGLKDWVVNILPMMMEGPKASAVYRTRRAIKDRFIRLDPPLPRVINLDDASDVTELLRVANETDLSEATEWFRRNWRMGQRA